MKYFRQLMEEATDGTEAIGMGGGEVSTPSWYYSKPNEEEGYQGVAGNGEVPEWFNVSKFKSIEDQAKSYGELEKRFGAFTGSPEEYEIPQELQDAQLDDGMLGILKEVGKEYQMGQGMFNDLVSKVVAYQDTQSEAMTKQAMEQLGEKAQERIQNVQNWLNTNAPKEIVDMIVPMATSAEAIQALEFFIGKSKGSVVANQQQAPQVQMTQAEYAEKLLALDSHGNYKMNSDPDYKKQMDEMAKQFIK